ncbi:hypothetical protein IE81DRAFT_292537 [Ceraceosorus guamensis]|uniref:Impact N-terminal domain-containing protein n=1 Tax=Ceraceosorus guamensis TaxID=1522189 RepID=A0A316VUS2_9BASI|nr:hypothetical protein IE81DRAFT_292537 [Ceraceosorus guamensis]PWN41004.1 hypothetical protein IE81DRAFT_292537 [Ceraceosorus guamensis]
MHDMYAWRVLKLKRGRDGLSGPGDWEIDQGCEDDGEKAGGRAVLRAIEKTGASDVLVIVSRWYGGTMLGPIRFEHIENCATEALRQFLDDEALVPLRKQLGDLDSEVLNLRARSSTSSSQTATPSTLAATASPTSRKVAPTYADLTKEKAERLISARRKQVEMLKRKLSQGSSTNPSPANLDNLDAAQRALAVLPP